jgi:hypothetical protein
MKTIRPVSPSRNQGEHKTVKTAATNQEIGLTKSQRLMLTRADLFVADVRTKVDELKEMGAPRPFIVGVLKRIRKVALASFDGHSIPT